MRKVKIKTWDEMEKEFGLKIIGRIHLKYLFTKTMEEQIPKNRIVEVDEKNKWGVWNISEDFIKKEIVPKKSKASKNKKINKLKTKLSESERKLGIANKTVCKQIDVIMDYLEHIEILEAKLSAANKTIKEKEKHLRIAENAIERKDKQFLGLRCAYQDEIINKG